MRYLSLAFFLLVSMTLNAQIEKIANFVTKGEYCQAAVLLEELKIDFYQKSKKGIEEKLLFAEVYMGLEEWDKVNKVLSSIAPNKIKKREVSIDYYLLNARLQKKLGFISEADSLFKLVLKELENVKSDYYYTASAYYGIFLFEINEYNKAEEILLKVQRAEVTPNSVIAYSSNVLGFLYEQRSQTVLAQNAYDFSKACWEAGKLQTHPDYALFLNDYANSKLPEGKLEQVEKLLNISDSLNSNGCTIRSISANIKSTRGYIAKRSDNYEEAILEFKGSLNIFRELKQKEEEATLLFLLGECYFYGFEDSIEVAENYILQSTYILDQIYSERPSLQKAFCLQGLGKIYDFNYDYEKADSVYGLAIQYLEQTIGNSSIAYGTAISNYAFSKEIQGDYEQAVNYYKQTEHQDTIIYSKYRADYVTTLYNLARCYAKLKKFNLSADYYKKANRLQLHLLDNYFINFDEVSRLNYRAKMMGNFDNFYTNACFSDSMNLARDVLKISLNTKNKALDYTLEHKLSSPTRLTSKEKVDYEDWIALKEKLTKFSLMSKSDMSELNLSFDSLLQRKQFLEKKIRRGVADLFSPKSLFSFEDIRSKLKAEEAAIDYFNFYITDEYGPFEDSIYYFATLILPNLDYPIIFPLLDEKELKQIFSKSSHYTKNVDINHSLYQKIWQPLAPYLNGVKKVHLSPDGYLRNPDYDLNFSVKLEDLEKGKPFVSLSGTASEILNVKQILKPLIQEVSFLDQQNATEIAVRTIIEKEQPSIVHLATHGFFFKKLKIIPPTQELNTLEKKIKYSKKSLLRSGIVLAGVNSPWLSSTDIIGSNDGIITALELTNLDLSFVELVVLSACETGKGDVLDGEGIYGLQRALKIAGVHYLLISLWKIPDEKTAELMKFFYQNLVNGENPENALFKAKMKMKSIYSSPFDWSGFVIFS